MSGKKAKSFEENMQRLEEIVSLLERGESQLADSLALFEEGTKLIASCSKQLDQAEQQVVKLMKGSDGAPVELPFQVPWDSHWMLQVRSWSSSTDWSSRYQASLKVVPLLEPPRMVVPLVE